MDGYSYKQPKVPRRRRHVNKLGDPVSNSPVISSDEKLARILFIIAATNELK